MNVDQAIARLQELDLILSGNANIHERADFFIAVQAVCAELSEARRLLAARPLSPAPCDKCGYNGPGYYQPATHPCAAPVPAQPVDDVVQRAHEIARQFKISPFTEEDARRLEPQLNAIGVTLGTAQPAVADDLRAAGLTVAVHNDCRLNGESHTFWLFVGPDGMSYKGEGRTDADALNQVRALLAASNEEGT